MDLDDDRRLHIEEQLQRAGVLLGERYRFDCFGNTREMASELGALVASGVKSATAAYDAAYDHFGEDRPRVGDVEIICDLDGNLLAVIEITQLHVVPFDEVDDEHARLEGEGDGSLEHWRRGHRRFFQLECAEMGVALHDRAPVLCQRFRLLHAPKSPAP